MEAADFFFYVWVVFRSLFIFLIIFFIVSGLDDLFQDIVYYLRWIFRALFRRKLVNPVTREQLNAVPEKAVAIMVPAWDESAVIGPMLLNTCSTLDYKNFVVFVGTYPNDEATRVEVEKIRDIYPNIEVAITPSDGPTNKADCLNWVYQGLLIYEMEHGVHFEIFVMHDSEDVIHPLSIKYYNYLIPRLDFIQLPVYPLEAKWTDLVIGVYMDEFAESHSKDLRIREALARSIPSAGVGTAMSRATIEFLASHHDNQIFDITSVTEDYLMGLKLEDFDGRKIFLQQDIERSGDERKEPIATRALFPTTFAAAVRQKSRWILGIALQGWSVGWGRSLGSGYYLFRDRKGVLTNILVVVGYVVFFWWAISGFLNNQFAGVDIPPLVETDEIWWNFSGLVLALFVWRIINRVGFTWRVYGLKFAVLAIPRLIYANVLNFCATLAAISEFASAKREGRVPEWKKTEHSFPSEEQLRRYRRRLGDILLDKRWVTSSQLEEALVRQKAEKRPLGELLVEMGVLWEEDVKLALSVQENRQSVEIDPYATPGELLKRVPQHLAEKHGVFPLAYSGERIVLATATRDRSHLEELKRALDATVELRHASEAEITFAISRAYADQRRPESMKVALGQRLLEKDLIDEKTLRKALREQKATDKPLGEVLIKMKAISKADLKEGLE